MGLSEQLIKIHEKIDLVKTGELLGKEYKVGKSLVRGEFKTKLGELVIDVWGSGETSATILGDDDFTKDITFKDPAKAVAWVKAEVEAFKKAKEMKDLKGYKPLD